MEGDTRKGEEIVSAIEGALINSEGMTKANVRCLVRNMVVFVLKEAGEPYAPTARVTNPEVVVKCLTENKEAIKQLIKEDNFDPNVVDEVIEKFSKKSSEAAVGLESFMRTLQEIPVKNPDEPSSGQDKPAEASSKQETEPDELSALVSKIRNIPKRPRPEDRYEPFEYWSDLEYREFLENLQRSIKGEQDWDPNKLTELMFSTIRTVVPVCRNYDYPANPAAIKFEEAKKSFLYWIAKEMSAMEKSYYPIKVKVIGKKKLSFWLRSEDIDDYKKAITPQVSIEHNGKVYNPNTVLSEKKSTER